MSIISDAKERADLIKAVGDIELHRKIVNLQGEIVELSGENVELKKENNDLKQALDVRQKMTYKKPFYYMEGDDEPYCANCWDGEGLTVHIRHMNESMVGLIRDCPRCKTNYS